MTEVEIVIGNRLSRGDDGLAHEHQLRRQQRSAYLIEYERVQGVGADVAFWAASFFASRFQGVMIRAVVVPVHTLRTPHLVAVRQLGAVTAFDKAAQQPRQLLQVARTPSGVVPADTLGRIEDVPSHDHVREHNCRYTVSSSSSRGSSDAKV